jgi:phospholipase/carboxylesterase
MVPHDAGIKTRDFLTTHGWPVSFQDYPMQHEVCIQEIEKVDAFLRQQLDG